MAHFVLKDARISRKLIRALRQDTLTIGLWGPMDNLVSPPRELDVVASPSARLRLTKSKLVKAGLIREWQLDCQQSGAVRIEAKAGPRSWDWFEIDIRPRSYRFLTAEQAQFIDDLALAGRQKAQDFNLPLSAMIACACGESRFGQSSIYQRTKNPFNLQKPADWEYPKCDTEYNSTENNPGETARPAPFCKAANLADAARQWCEWITHYPRENAKSQLLALRGNPRAFAESLYLVNFASSLPDRTKKFGEVWEQYELRRFDSA